MLAEKPDQQRCKCIQERHLFLVAIIASECDHEQPTSIMLSGHAQPLRLPAVPLTKDITA